MNQAYRQLIDTLFPRGTQRRHWFGLGQEAVRIWRAGGVRSVAQRAYLRLANRGKQNAPTVTNPAEAPLSYTYADWIRDHEPDAAQLAQQRAATPFGYCPLISILTPVYNPPLPVLRETIASVQAQTYPHWTLCLANGGGADDPALIDFLNECARQDSRIKLVHLAENLGISGNTNAALALATGEFLALLDHDDLMAPNLLYAVVERLNQQPEADIVYFDEDKITADGLVRNQPWFKPDWSPDLMFSANLLMHSVLRRALVEQVNRFDPAMDGAQDWDLALRCATQTTKILHLPQVLYHWRQIEGSAALDANAKPWAYPAQARCLRAHLTRLGFAEAQVEFPALGVVRILFPTAAVKVSLIIPTKHNTTLLRACLTSIFQHTIYPDYEIILVDTGSTDPDTLAYYETLATDPRVRIVYDPGPFNYSRANNLGARHATGELYLFLNNDTEALEATWLAEMVGWARRPEIGVVGAKLIRPDGTLQHAGIVMGMTGHGSHIFDGGPAREYGIFGSTEWYRNYQAVTGACMMMRREVFAALHGFDETYIVGYSDIELCLRAATLGYRIVYTPFACLLHYEGGSRGFYLPPSDVLRATGQMLPFVRQGDPYFNPNLSYHHRRPTFAQPNEAASEAQLVEILQGYDLLPRTMKPTADSVWAVPPPMPPAWPQLSNTTELMPDQLPKVPPKVLLVSHDLSLSGAPLMMLTLAAYLAQAGFQVTILSPLDGPLHANYQARGIALLYEPDLLEEIQDAVLMAQLLMPYDLIIVNTIVLWRTIQAARAYCKPTIWWLHEGEYGSTLCRKTPNIVRSFLVANRIFFPTQATIAQYAEFLDYCAYQMIPYGLDSQTLAPTNLRVTFPPGKIRIICVGSLERRKGQDFLLKAIAELPVSLLNTVECYLLGRVIDPKFAQSIAKLAKKLPNVHWVGEVTHAETMAYLQACDIFVLASRDEVLPVSMLEAMYYAKAIIVTRVGGTSEAITHGVNGLLVDVDDHIALRDQIMQLCQDQTLRTQLGQQAQETFRTHYTVEHFGQSVVQVINELINK